MLQLRKFLLRTILITGFIYLVLIGYDFILGQQTHAVPIHHSLNIKHHSIQNGDLIFQTSNSSQSKAIQLATHSKYSHMGIIFENNDRYYVYEAIQPVTYTPLDKWIERGQDDHYVIKRLRNSESLITPKSVAHMKIIGEQYKGSDYDIYFEWSDERMYCSELVWKIYKEAFNIEIGQLQKLSEFDLSHTLVKQKMHERYGTNIPLNEKVISPAAMFNSDKLITIEER
ncbi:YiiX family permuted papain-like enzyme [bacterium SCSIO 12643]|nr:YiiX family permuted papain-like enzyme [bacterium SCSIO 12643]